MVEAMSNLNEIRCWQNLAHIVIPPFAPQYTHKQFLLCLITFCYKMPLHIFNMGYKQHGADAKYYIVLKGFCSGLLH